MADSQGDNTPVIVGLLFLWILLILVLFYLYKRLNHESNNQYSVQHLVYSQGGLRDRAVQGVAFVTSFVDRIRPRNTDEEAAIGGNGDTDSREDGEEEEDGEDKDGEGACHSEAKQDVDDEEEDKDDSSDDYSSVDLKERVMRNNGSGEMGTEEKQKGESSKTEGKEEEPKQQEEVKDEERVGLLVNIKPFSGSAIWSEEKTEENVTAL